MQRRGWGLPNSRSLTWNAIGFECAGERPQFGRQQFLGLGGTDFVFLVRVDLPMGAIFFDPENGGTGIERKTAQGYVGALCNKRAFDPPLYISNPHAPSRSPAASKHTGNMTRGRTVGACPQTGQRSATPSRQVELLGARRWN